MGYCERFFYCDKEKDTRRFLEILEKYKPDDIGYKLAEITTFKRNYILRHKEIKGMQIGEHKMPFNYVTPLEIENSDKFYRANNIPEDLEDLIADKVTTYYGEEQEHFFQKNDTLIWLTGNRGNMADVYNLFGIGAMAVQLMLDMQEAGQMEPEWLVDGKIDIENILLDAKKAIARIIFTDEEFEVISKVKFIDLDGVDDIDAKLWDTTLFKHKKYRAA